MSKIAQIQEIIGTDPDGQWGPLSQAALNALIRQSTAGPAIPQNPPLTSGIHPFVSVAAEWVGKSETTRNRFDGDKDLWADTNYPDGWIDRAPYCAAFQCHVVAEAARRGAHVQTLPKSQSVSEFRNWARRLGYVVTSPRAGDHFTLLPSGTSHIGLVERVEGDLICTIEGNTDGEGSREGDGFWRKTRRIDRCDFFRIPA